MAQEAILIIDDHALFRSGSVSMLSTAFDRVLIRETRPLSRLKRWELAEVLVRRAVLAVAPDVAAAVDEGGPQ